MDHDRQIERRILLGMSRLSWGLIALMGAVAAAVAAAPGISFDGSKVALNAPLAAVFGLMGIVYAHWRYDLAVAALADAVAQLMALVLLGAAFTYAMAVLGASSPLVDARLLAADRALGFDWLACLRWLNAHPTVAAGLGLAYGSIAAQALVLVLFGRARRLWTILLAAQIAVLACGIISAFAPALGVFEHLDVTRAIHHADIALANGGRLDVRDMLQLRGPAPAMRAHGLVGIIMFPSFHMALAILFAWAFWAVPGLRWPGLALNVAMALATPLSGGHYLVDLLAGAAVALASLRLAAFALATLERRAAGRVKAALVIPTPAAPFGTAAAAPG